MPMNQGINLLNPNYVPVVKDQKTYYGGSQMWFSDNKKLSTDRLLHNYGCGTIATADSFLTSYCKIKQKVLDRYSNW